MCLYTHIYRGLTTKIKDDWDRVQKNTMSSCVAMNRSWNLVILDIYICILFNIFVEKSSKVEKTLHEFKL